MWSVMMMEFGDRSDRILILRVGYSREFPSCEEYPISVYQELAEGKKDESIGGVSGGSNQIDDGRPPSRSQGCQGALQDKITPKIEALR